MQLVDSHMLSETAISAVPYLESDPVFGMA